MIQSYTKYKQFKSLVDAKENGKAVRSGLDFLRFVAEEYCRLEVYNNQECDGDDFFTYQVEKELAQVLRDEATPIESVATAQKEMAEIEKMEAYDDYCLCFFDHIREAINFRLADADTYLADLDRQIKHHTHEYKRLVNDENFDQLSSLFRFEELGKLLIKKIEYLRTHDRENEEGAILEEYRRLFRQFLVDKRPYFEKLKELVAKADWDEFVVKLFGDIPHITDDILI